MTRRRVEAPPRPTATLLDRAIAVVRPAVARDRLMARWQMSAITGGYTGASRRRRSMQEWNAPDQSADAALLPALDLLRIRSRDLQRNNPLAAGAIHTKVTSIVGTGLKCRPAIDRAALGWTEEAANAWERAALRIWNEWAGSEECDAARSLRFSDVQELAFRSVLESGDVFVLKRFFARPGGDFETKLQLIEGDRVGNPRHMRDTATMAGGVEFGANGEPLRYHIADGHAGDIARGGKSINWTAVDVFGAATGRRVVLHLHRKLRVGQTRGMPDLAPVIEALKQLGDYRDAELQAAVIAAMFTVFVKTDAGEGMGPMTPAAETGASASDTDMKLAPGAIIDLAAGESVDQANPMRPNPAFDPFVQAILRQVGVALELPFEILIKHFTASYSAARAALLEAWKYYRGRRAWLAAGLCQPTYEWVMAEAVARGWIEAPGFFTNAALRHAYLAAEWHGDAMPSIDPLKENKANVIAEDRGWKTASQITSENTGGDWEKNHPQRVHEEKLRREGGVVPPSGVSGGAEDARRAAGADMETEDLA